MGNPLYRWDIHAGMAMPGAGKDKIHVEMVDIIRIDHFRGFAGYWKSRDGKDCGDWSLDSRSGKRFFQQHSKLSCDLPLLLKTWA